MNVIFDKLFESMSVDSDSMFNKTSLYVSLITGFSIINVNLRLNIPGKQAIKPINILNFHKISQNRSIKKPKSDFSLLSPIKIWSLSDYSLTSNYFPPLNYRISSVKFHKLDTFRLQKYRMLHTFDKKWRKFHAHRIKSSFLRWNEKLLTGTQNWIKWFVSFWKVVSDNTYTRHWLSRAAARIRSICGTYEANDSKR